MAITPYSSFTAIGPLVSARTAAGDLLYYSYNSDGVGGGLFRLHNGQSFRLGDAVGSFNGMTALSDGAALLFRQDYESGGTSFGILNANGTVRVGLTSTEPNGDGAGKGEYTSGPVAVARSDGGFFFAVTDRTYSDQAFTLQFPADVNGHTSGTIYRGSDLSHRIFNGQGVAQAPFVFDTPATTFNNNGTTGDSRLGDQNLSAAVALRNGAVVEASVETRYFTGYSSVYGYNGAVQQSVVSLTLVGAGRTTVVQANTEPLSTDGFSPTRNAIQGAGGVQLVSLRQGGFAAIWQENTYVADASVYGGYRSTGLDAVIRYFDASGNALSDEVHFLHRSSSYDYRSLYLSADALPDGRIVAAYVADATDGASGSGMYVATLGALGASVDIAPVLPTLGMAVANLSSREVRSIAGDSRFDVSYYDGTGRVLTYGAGNLTQTRAAGDTNGEGTSDILLQSGSTVVSWSMNNGLYDKGSVLTTGATGFTVRGTGDFNADGTADVVLQSGGTVVDWILKNGAYQSGNIIATGADGFTVVGTGDFNGDGTTDILLQNGGTVVEWLMKDGHYQSGSVITTGAASFLVVGTGDLNGDGTSDILLQSGGTVVEWIMKNGAYQSGSILTTGAGGFRVAGTGDFNGDGTDDVVLQSGDVVVDWIMKNGAYQSGNVLTTAAGGFKVSGTGDYNGDGTSDIVLQSGGSVVDWTMQNGVYASGNVITTAAADFRVV